LGDEGLLDKRGEWGVELGEARFAYVDELRICIALAQEWGSEPVDTYRGC
jgi:hypothetical protein